jgi:hypothetical protein
MLTQQYVISLPDRLFSEYFMLHACREKSLFQLAINILYILSFQIKLMVLNPEHGFVSDRPLARDDVQLLVDICVQKLSEEYSPSLATLQMQVYFDTNFATRHDIINENRANNKLRTIPLIKEIIDTYTKTKEDHEKLYRKIVVTTATISGLGNPTHLSVLREATGKLII